MLIKNATLDFRYCLFLLFILRGTTLDAQSWQLPLGAEFTDISLSNTSVVKDSQYLIYGKSQAQYKCLFVDDRGKIVQKAFPKKHGYLTPKIDSGYIIATPQHANNASVLVESYDKSDNLRFSQTIPMKPNNYWVQIGTISIRELSDKNILLVIPKRVTQVQGYKDFVEIKVLDEKGDLISSLELNNISVYERPQSVSTLIDISKQTIILHDGFNLKRISFRNSQISLINESKSEKYIDRLIAEYPYQNRDALLFLTTLNNFRDSCNNCYRLTIMDLESRVLGTKDISFNTLNLTIQTAFRDDDKGLWIFAKDQSTPARGYLSKLNASFFMERIYEMEISPLNVLRSPNGIPVIIQPNAIYTFNTEKNHKIKGKVVLSTDTIGCQPSTDRVPNAMITVTGDTKTYIFTDSLGNFNVDLPAGKFTFNAISPIGKFGYNSTCFETSVNILGDKNENIDLTLVLKSYNCHRLNIELSPSFLRRCFKGNTYFLTCQNLGKAAKNTYIDLTLDKFMLFGTSVTPFKKLSNTQVRLFLGDIPAGQIKKISFNVEISCEAKLGAVHCIEARVSADSCNTQNDDNLSLRLSKDCQNGILNFKVQNLKNTPLNTNIRLIRNDTLLSNEILTLSPQSNILKSLTAKGEVFRHEVRFNGQLWSQFEEGCGNTNSNYSIIHNPLNYPIQQITPSLIESCMPNIGSYDPNDKTGYPLGVGAKHFIETNQDLDYIIRFQNTGTDTAFKVIIRDILDKNLDAATLRIGVSSHPFSVQWQGKDTISFVFDNILLPDSFRNEPKSHGFIRFKISQKQDLPIGTTIKNQASIYFDFNEPIITNTTFHTIGRDFIPSIISKIDTINESDYEVSISPNPAIQSVRVSIQNIENPKNYSVILFDLLGREVKKEIFNTNSININRENLENGIYIMEVRVDYKIIKRQNIIFTN